MPPHIRKYRVMKRIAKFLCCTLLLFVATACGKVRPVTEVPEIHVGEPTFFPTIVAHTDAPIIGANRIDILLNGDEVFPAMLRDIKSARQTITFAQYLYQDGTLAREFAEALAERCRAGVKGHILLDSQGARSLPDAITSTMRDAGCKVEFFRRVEAPQVVFIWRLLRYNYRNHRRSLVIDGKIGFTGGYGISDAWLGDGHTSEHWRDTNVRVEGPLVNDLQAAFVGSWFEATGALLGGTGYFPSLEPRGNITAQIVKSSPVGGSFQNYMLFLLSIVSAKQSIMITNPYFIPDDKIIEALLAAAARRVRVTVLVPGKIDVKLTYRASRRNYGKMLQGGIEIYEYQPALMHAKTMIVDGVWATVGSTNMDNRSFALNEELNLAVYDRAFARKLENIFRDDLRYSRKITYAEWAARPWRERFFELFAFPFQEQL
jgi:cardiolipin synthase